MIGRVLALGVNTFREAVRNRVLYLLLLFALALIFSALALGQLSLHEEGRVTRDVGLGGIALFGVLIAIFVGVNLVYKELDKKTVFTLVSRPIHRHELILGKFVGMSLTLLVQLAIMGATLCAVLALEGAEISPAIARAITLTFLEVVVVTAIAILFSSFSTPLLSGGFTLGLFVIGRSVPELRELVGKMDEGALRAVAGAFLHLAPDLRLFAVSGSMVDGRYASVHADFVSWGYVGWAGLYALGYAACVLTLAAALFARRDFV
jgi:ABC-type transport system involved in multi-copper enzyme maturation permease subunit